MDLHRYRCALLAGTAIALAPAASAQLVVTNDDSAAGEPNAWLIDVNTDVATPLWSGMQAWGAAADDANRTIWANNGSTLYSVDYDTLTPTAGVPIVDATGAQQRWRTGPSSAAPSPGSSPAAAARARAVGGASY